MRVQDVAESALKEHLEKHNALWGCAILMEIETGEIRAIANLEKDEKLGYIEKYNHAIGTPYEPGSSFKLFSMLSLIEDGYIPDLDSLVHTGNGKIKVGKNTISDAHPLGTITVRQVFEKSSNVGTVLLIKKFYERNPKKFISKLVSMKMQMPMGIDIKGEKRPHILTPDSSAWSRSSLVTMSYGYGLSITPLQLLAYYNAVVNNGVLVRPLFVKEFRSSGKTMKTFSPVILHQRICSMATCKVLMSLMEGVVEHGTATNLKNSACKIAGKTGTARIYDNEAKAYSMQYNASFVGYFPADNPKYSCIVLVNRPSMGSIYGSNVAAPVFRDIAEIVFATELEIHDSIIQKPFSGIQSVPGISAIRQSSLKNFLKLMPEELQAVSYPDAKWVRLKNDSVPAFETVSFKEKTMPDVSGMNLRDACYLLESMGCIVRATGKGKVETQSVTGGTEIKKGQIVYLNLR